MNVASIFQVDKYYHKNLMVLSQIYCSNKYIQLLLYIILFESSQSATHNIKQNKN